MTMGSGLRRSRQCFLWVGQSCCWQLRPQYRASWKRKWTKWRPMLWSKVREMKAVIIYLQSFGECRSHERDLFLQWWARAWVQLHFGERKCCAHFQCSQYCSYYSLQMLRSKMFLTWSYYPTWNQFLIKHFWLWYKDIFCIFQSCMFVYYALATLMNNEVFFKSASAKSERIFWKVLARAGARMHLILASAPKFCR